MIFTSLALIATLRTSRLPATVTYSNPGARLEVLLPELSKATGLKLVPSTEMKGLPVVVRFQDLPVQQALDKLAFATRGVWSVEKGGRVLHEDTVGIKKEQDEAMEQHLGAMRRIWAELRSNRPNDPSYFSAAYGTPPNVAVEKIIPFLDENRAIKLDRGQHLVYSNKPKPLQQALPQAVIPIVVEMIKALNEGPPILPDHEKEHIVGVPFKVNVIVTSTGFSQYDEQAIAVQVNAYDKDGHLLTSHSARAWDDVFLSQQAHYVLASDREVARPLRIDPVYFDILRFWHEDANPTPAVLKVVKQPLLHDPIEPEGATLVAYAQMHGEQLAGAITDPMTFDWVKHGMKTETDSGFIHWILQWHDDWRKEKGWILVRREIPTVLSRFEGREIMDRHRIQQLVDALPSLKNPSLQSRIRAVRLGVDELGQHSWWNLPQYRLVPDTGSGRDDEISRSMALLTDKQIETLLEGGRVVLSETPPAFQRHFSIRTEGSRRYMPPTLFRDPPVDSKGVTDGTSSEADLDQEFTEVADQAMPRGAYLQLLLSDSLASTLSSPSEQHDSVEGAAPADEVPDVPSRRILNYELRYYITPTVYFRET